MGGFKNLPILNPIPEMLMKILQTICIGTEFLHGTDLLPVDFGEYRLRIARTSCVFLLTLSLAGRTVSQDYKMAFRVKYIYFFVICCIIGMGAKIKSSTLALRLNTRQGTGRKMFLVFLQ